MDYSKIVLVKEKQFLVKELVNVFPKPIDIAYFLLD